MKTKPDNIIFLVILAFIAISGTLYSQIDGEKAYQLYCSRCHGAEQIRSGTLVFYSKKTIIDRYKNKSVYLLEKLENIDRHIKSHVMIRAVHKIQDRTVIIQIVNHLSDPDLKIPGIKDKGL